MDREERTSHELEHRLREERPQLSVIELDDLKQTVLSRVSDPDRRGPGFLRSRFSLVLILTMGVLMSSTGATMAVTGIAGQGNAAQSQYFGPSGATQGEQQTGGNEGTDGTDDGAGDNGTGDEGDTLGDQNQGGTNGSSGDSSDGQSVARSNDQVAAASDGRLPFTGLMVFPLLLGGVALLIAGGFLRHRTSRI